MKIQIINDVFDIVNRLKEIDESYYVVYDNMKKRFEVWSDDLINTMCFVVPFDSLDYRTINYAYMTNSNNAQKIYDEIEKFNNDKIVRDKNKIVDENSYKFKEIFNYEKLSKQMTTSKAFCAKWV